MIIIPTVPHTGTNFVVKLFTDLGYKQNSLVDAHIREPALRSGHIVKEGQFNLAKQYIAQGHPAVIPIRHPYVVAESWKRRDKPIEDMITAYRRLPELDGYFLPLDVDNRESYLQAVSDGLGVPINTKWPVVNSYHGTHELRWTDIEPDPEIRALAEEMEGFLSQFYPPLS